MQTKEVTVINQLPHGQAPDIVTVVYQETTVAETLAETGRQEARALAHGGVEALEDWRALEVYCRTICGEI